MGDMPEKAGKYYYYLKMAELPRLPTEKQSSTYEIYMRSEKQSKNADDGEEIFDITQVPFLQPQLLRHTMVSKIKMSDDHSLLAFTLEVGADERI